MINLAETLGKIIGTGQFVKEDLGPAIKEEIYSGIIYSRLPLGANYDQTLAVVEAGGNFLSKFNIWPRIAPELVERAQEKGFELTGKHYPISKDLSFESSQVIQVAYIDENSNTPVIIREI